MRKIQWKIYHKKCELLTFLYKKLPYVNGTNKKKNNERIIISLTSYPARFSSLKITLKSLFFQTMKPDEIVLYLSKDQCEGHDLSELKYLEKYGLTIVLCENDYKSHKKYYYSFSKYKNDVVITVDDDVIYPMNLVKRLYRTSLKYLKSVVASKVVYMGKKYDKREMDYTKQLSPDFHLLPIGVGGVLYRPQQLVEDVCDIKNAMQYAQYDDDIWLKVVEIKSRVPVVYARKANDKVIINKEDKGSPLAFIDREDPWKRLTEYFHIDDNFLDELDNSLNIDD